MKLHKRLMAAGMAAALMMTSAACSQSGETESTSNVLSQTSTEASSSSVASTEESGLFDENGKYLEPVKLTYSKVMYPGAKFPADQSPEDNHIHDFLKERYNIEMELAWSAESSEYNNKLSINIASGELCDLMYVDNYFTFRQMAENDLLADLTEIYPQYRGEN